MASKESSGKKDDRSEAQERQHRRRERRPPHRFTQEELKILKQSFEQNPYPTFSTKEELAKQLRCRLYVIQNWFQDRRCRLPPREKKRLFATWKLNGFCVQRSQPLWSPNIQVQSDDSSTNPTSLHDQETLPQRAGDSSLETQMIPRGYFDSGDSVVPGINREPGYPLEYQGAPASGPSSTSTPDSFIYPNASMQCLESTRYEAGETQHALPYFSYYAFSGQGTGCQQEEHKAPDQYLVFQGQQPNPWGCHLQQLSQPWYYEENRHLPFQGQVLLYPNPSDLRQQELNIHQGSKVVGGVLSCLLQVAPVHIADSSPQPLGEGKQQDHAEHSRFEIQQLQNGVFPDVHC